MIMCRKSNCSIGLTNRPLRDFNGIERSFPALGVQVLIEKLGEVVAEMEKDANVSKYPNLRRNSMEMKLLVTVGISIPHPRQKS
jgi:hypothetical protein